MSESFWRRRNVFVTGATGLLGSALTSELLRCQANVIALVRDGVPSSALVGSGDIDRVTVVRGDLVDLAVLQRAVHEYEIDSVFHLGAQTIVPIANRHPLGTFESNIKGSWNLLEACRGSRAVERIVMASTDKAYGTQASLPYSEEAPLQGQHPYDVSKSCADLLAQAYAKTYAMPIGITRCGNLYGPGDLNFNRIVPGTIRSLLHGERPIVRSDGRFVRDYFYIPDAVRAYMFLAMALDRPSLHGEAFNFSTENRLTVLELVELITKLIGKDLGPVVLNEASNEIREQSLSSAKARRLLDWAPEHTLEQGLTETIAWYRQIV